MYLYILKRLHVGHKKVIINQYKRYKNASQSLRNGFQGELTTLVVLVIWYPQKNMYDMKPNTYHSIHEMEQVSVSESLMLAQTKGHRRVHKNIR